MQFLFKILIAVPILIIPIAPFIKAFLRRRKHFPKSLADLENKYNPDLYQFKVIFVSQLRAETCRYHLYKANPCGSECAYEHLEKIKNYVLSAKSSISILMYHLTIESLAETIIKCAKRNIKIRCICDQVMARTTASKFKDFPKHGIEVRAPNQSEGMMHHKVIIVDSDLASNQGKVLQGSMNMTMQGLTQNWDMFSITNSKDIVMRFNEEFDYLWEQFQPMALV